MQEQAGLGSQGQAHPVRADGGSSPHAAGQQLPHAQKYMLLHTLSQQLEAGRVDNVIQQIKGELDPDFFEQHPDLFFELQRYGRCLLIKFSRFCL